MMSVIIFILALILFFLMFRHFDKRSVKKAVEIGVEQEKLKKLITDLGAETLARSNREKKKHKKTAKLRAWRRFMKRRKGNKNRVVRSAK